MVDDTSLNSVVPESQSNSSNFLLLALRLTNCLKSKKTEIAHGQWRPGGSETIAAKRRFNYLQIWHEIERRYVRSTKFMANKKIIEDIQLCKQLEQASSNKRLFHT